jgi:hypothetical protein
VCAELSVCIVDEIAPTCTAKADDAGACPTGQTETQCGGIGYPCCCEPTPPPEYRCEGKGICGTTPDCTCLGPTICNNGQMCIGIGGKDWEFHCVDPAQP